MTGLLGGVQKVERLYFYHTDHLGTPILMTDESGSVVWEAEYLPFGEVYSMTGTVENNLRFPVQYFDSETGLHYNWHRYYKPEVGRFTRPDPSRATDPEVMKAEIEHLYVYGGNSPVLYVDVTGLCKWTGWMIVNIYGEVPAGGYIIMPLQSECCNCKRVSGLYIAIVGGGMLGALPVQATAQPVELEGPETPCKDDPKGFFEMVSGGGAVGIGYSITLIKTGELSGELKGRYYGIDLGVELVFGYTVGSGNEMICR